MEAAAGLLWFPGQVVVARRLNHSADEIASLLEGLDQAQGDLLWRGCSTVTGGRTRGCRT